MSETQPEPEAVDVDEETMAELAAALDGNEDALVEFLSRLDTINDVLDVVDLGTQAMDDEMVVMLADTANAAGTLADTATEPETVRGIESLLHAVGDSAGDLDEPPQRVGMVGMLKAMRDPEVQTGLGFMIALAKNLGADLNRRSEMRR